MTSSPHLEEEKDAAVERQRVVQDAFHALSQPLTALHCSLELALREARPDGPLQEGLQAALSHAERIVYLANGIRELVDAPGAGEERSVVSLEKYVREALADLLPVAQVAQVNLRMQCDSDCSVLTAPQRLGQALFYLFESAIASAAPGSVLPLEAAVHASEVVLLLTITRGAKALSAEGSEVEQAQELSRRLGLAIAGRVVESAGGKLQMQESAGQLRLRLRLPAAASTTSY